MDNLMIIYCAHSVQDCLNSWKCIYHPHRFHTTAVRENEFKEFSIDMNPGLKKFGCFQKGYQHKLKYCFKNSVASKAPMLAIPYYD